MCDLLRIDKQPPMRVEGDPSSLQEGREKLLTELRATMTECKENAGSFHNNNPEFSREGYIAP